MAPALSAARAKIQGDFEFAAGERLEIVVGAGQLGSYYGGGGGGGSFVMGPDGKPLLAAGGGGGAGGGVGPRGSNPTPPGWLPLVRHRWAERQGWRRRR